MFVQKLFNLTIALLLVFSMLPGAAIAQSSMPEATSQATIYLLTLPVPEVQVPHGTPASQVAGYYQVALQKAWSQTEALLASLKEDGLVESYTLRADQNAFEVTALPAAAEKLAQVGTLNALDEAVLVTQSADQFRAELQAAIQGAQRQERRPGQGAAQDKAPRPPQTFYISLETEQAGKERGLGAVGSQLSGLQQDGVVAGFEWLPELNAFKVSATRELQFLTELPGVTEVSTLEPALVLPDRAALRGAAGLPEPDITMAILATTPNIQVQVFSSYLYLESTSNQPVTLTLSDPDGVVKNDPANTSFDGWYFDGVATYFAWAYLYDSGFSSAYMMPGDTLNVAQNLETPFDYEIPDIYATVDRDTDTVYGVGPANMVLEVYANGVNHDSLAMDYTSAFATTDASGAFSTQLDCLAPDTCTLDLRGDTNGDLYYLDADGNAAYVYFHAPMLYAQLSSGYVQGYAEPLTDVTVSLLNAAGVSKASFDATTSSSGNFWGNLYDPYGNYVPVLPGDSLLLESAMGTVITLEAVELSAVGNVTTDMVSGTAPADTTPDDISLPSTVACASWCEYLTPDSSGAFTTGVLGDLVAGSYVQMGYRSAEADQLSYYFQIPVVFVRGENGYYNSENIVSGYGYMGLVQVNLLRGTDTIATAYDNNYSTNWQVYFEDIYGYPVPIQGGDEIEVIQELVTTLVGVPAFSGLVSDVAADEVTGNTDAVVTTTTLYAPESLAVWPQSTSDWEYGKYVLPNAAGDFLAGNPFYDNADPINLPVVLNILPGNHGHLRYIDAAGHYVYEDFTALTPTADPVVYVRGSYGEYYVNEGYVSGYVTGPCSDVDITVRDSADVIKGYRDNVSACPAFYASINDVYGNLLQIAAGDTVEVSSDDGTTEVAVPAFSGLTSDAAADEVTGNTDAVVTSTTYGAPETLAIWPQANFDWEYGKYVLPDAAGDFLAGNPFYWDANDLNPATALDILPGNQGHLRYVDADGNRVYATFMAPYEFSALTVSVRGNSSQYVNNNFVQVYNPNCGDVDLVLKDSAGQEKAAANLWACNTSSTNFNGPGGAPINIVAGDTLEATYEDQTTVVEVPAFSGLVSDAVTDEVTGNTDAVVTTEVLNAPESLAVWPQSTADWEYGKYVTPDAAGGFEAANPFYDDADPLNIPVVLDILPEDHGHLRYIDTDGNRVYDDFVSMYLEPELWIHKDTNRLSGRWTEADAELQVSLTRAGSEVASLAALTDRFGGFGINLYDDTGMPGLILEDDTLTVSDGSATETVAIPRLTGVADSAADTISGEAPPDSPLGVWVEWTVVAAVSDGDGAYNASFLGLRDLLPGDEYEVAYLNPDGHAIYIMSFIGPRLVSLLNSPSVWGIGTAADQEVSLTLTRAGSEYAWDTTSTYWNNEFDAHLYNAAGQPVQIQAGDMIAAAFADGTSTSMTAAALTAEVDADADLVSGTGPAGEPLEVAISSFSESVTPNTAGIWQVDPGAAGVNLTAGAQALVRHAASLAAETWLYATAPVVYVRGNGSGSTSYIDENYLSGYAARSASVEVTLERGGDVIAQRLMTANWDGYFGGALYDALDLDADILGGDEVLVNDVTVPVPEIQAELDAEADTVSGFGPPDAQLGVRVDWPAYQNQTVTTAVDGSFSATFNDFYADSYAYIRYANPDGNWIHALFQAEPAGSARIEARWNYDTTEVCDSCVSGYAGTRYAPVHLSLLREGATVAAAVDMSNHDSRFFGQFTESSGAPVAIEPGDQIEALSSGVTISMTVAALTAQVNQESGVLFGEGPAGGMIYSNWGSSWIEVGADGRYFDDIGAENGARGYVYYPDTDANRTYTGWAYPGIWIRANSNYVDGHVEPDVPVLVELFNSNGGLRASAETTSNIWDGYFEVYFTNLQGEPIIIQPGDTLVVTASPTTEVVVPVLTAVVDKANDQVTGLGPVDSQLGVYVGSGPVEAERNPFTAADGAYTADFSDAIDIQGGDYTYVEAMLPDGNGIWLETRAPMVNVNTANDIVDGYNTPMARISLALVRSGITLASTTTEAGYWDGFFTAFFTDADDELIDILPGDTVQVTASPSESFTTVAITAEINPAAGSISGTGPANAALLVKAFVWFIEPYNMWEHYGYETLPAYTNAAGEFTVDFSSTLPLDGTSHVYIEYRDSTGNVSSFNTLPEHLPAVDLVTERVMNEGAQLRDVYAGVANDEDITPPILVQTSGEDLILEAFNGDLIITTPEGTVIDTYDNDFQLEDSGMGVWQIQIRKYDTNGSSYAIAIGVISPYRNYLPTVMKHTP